MKKTFIFCKIKNHIRLDVTYKIIPDFYLIFLRVLLYFTSFKVKKNKKAIKVT